MKRALVFLTVGIFLIGVTIYIVQNFSPFEVSKIEELVITNEIAPGEWDKLNESIKELVNKGLIFDYLSSYALMAATTILFSVFSIFTGFHLIIDKLFFKNFYEEPSISTAIRRGMVLLAALALIFYMHFSKVDSQLIYLVPVTGILLEILIGSYIKSFKAKKLLKKDQQTPIDRTL